MTLQNRVLPTGEIVSQPFRGEWMGNRGILHDHQRRLGAARWRHQNWVCCALQFNGRKRELMAPGYYTELFFLDDATALAVGHRPCAECRRADYRAFKSAWETCLGPATAAEMDRKLHRARVDSRSKAQVRVCRDAMELPDGAMFLPEPDQENHIALMSNGAMRIMQMNGYGGPLPVPNAEVVVLTPAPILSVLAAGYRPQPHKSLASASPPSDPSSPRHSAPC